MTSQLHQEQVRRQTIRLEATEKQFQQSVIELARLRGYLCYHTHNSRRSAKGFPDLVLVRERDARIIFAELKSEKGTVSQHQREWLQALELTSAEVYVFRPSDWDTIEEVLK